MLGPIMLHWDANKDTYMQMFAQLRLILAESNRNCFSLCNERLLDLIRKKQFEQPFD